MNRSFAFLFACFVGFLASPALLPAQEAAAKSSAGEDAAVLSGAEPLSLTLPSHTTELGRIGAAAFAKGEWEKSRQAYAEILESDPDNPLALSNLAAVEFQLGELVNARAHLEKAVREEASLTQSWITLGLVYRRLGDTHLALSALARAVHTNPGDSRAHRYLAIVLRDLGWITGAESEMQKAIELDPGDAEAHFNLALMYFERQPPAIELGRRHYHIARDLGAAPDEEIEKQIAKHKTIESGGGAP